VTLHGNNINTNIVDRRAWLSSSSGNPNTVSQLDVWKAGAAAITAVLAEYAALAAAFPSPDPLSKGAAAVAGGMAEFLAGENFGEKLAAFTQQS
jgi:hypothetical protein